MNAASLSTLCTYVMHASRSTARGAARVQLNMQDPIFETLGQPTARRNFVRR